MEKRKKIKVVNLSEYLTIKKAAQLLGVSMITLRRWDSTGKFRARRHPVNGFRLYKKDDLEKLLKKVR